MLYSRCLCTYRRLLNPPRSARIASVRSMMEAHSCFATACCLFPAFNQLIGWPQFARLTSSRCAIATKPRYATFPSLVGLLASFTSSGTVGQRLRGGAHRTLWTLARPREHMGSAAVLHHWHKLCAAMSTRWPCPYWPMGPVTTHQAERLIVRSIL